MKFEEALTQMRLGKKITEPNLGDDVYLQACRVGLMGMPQEDMPISIVKMQGDRQHPDMGTGRLEHAFSMQTMLEPPCKHGFCPQLNLFLVMVSKRVRPSLVKVSPTIGWLSEVLNSRVALPIRAPVRPVGLKRAM